MKPSGPLVYTNVSQSAFDQFKVIAKGHGLNIAGNKDNTEWDKIGVGVEFDPEKERLTFLVHNPHWLQPHVTSGALHEMVSESLRAVEDNRAQQDEQNRVDAHRNAKKAEEGREKGTTHAVDTSQKHNGPDHNRFPPRK